MPQLPSTKPLLSTCHHTVTSDPLCHINTWGQWHGTPNQGESKYKEIKYCAWEDSTGIRNTFPQHRKIYTLMSDSSILTVTDSSSAADDMCGLRKWEAYMESRKMVPKNLFAGQQWRNRYREQIYGHGERGGESEIYGESSMETYITICKIDSQ